MGAEAPSPDRIADNIKPLKNGQVALINRHFTALTMPPPAGAPPAPPPPLALTPTPHSGMRALPSLSPSPFKNAPRPPPLIEDDDRSFWSRHRCLAWFLAVLVLLLIGLGLAVLICYLVYKPKTIVFKVESISTLPTMREQLLPTTPTTLGLSGTIVITGSINNPNRFSFNYNNITGNLTFGEVEKQQLAEGRVIEGSVGKKSTSKFDFNLDLDTKGVGPKAAELSQAIAGGTVYTYFRTTVTGTVKFLILKRNYEANIWCNTTITLRPTPPTLTYECSPEVKIK